MKALPKLYRKRYYPEELIYLKDDIILKQTDTYIITKWDTLKPRKDICRGISAYFLKEGYKISKVYNHENNLVYWYCDIIDTEYIEKENAYIFHDLLMDVLIYPDNRIEVVDLDELGVLLEDGKITIKMCSRALKIADSLLKLLYNHEFYNLQNIIEELE